ncbi:hypothetical protein [Bradyrhizobium centrolobii]|uniref:hypothetical protein n=1 Tax=Bradyrhizobium centrolobii TaxID=1505087 RepID=UPI000AF50776|nr:hypothetical protein [Bradyrhizobium centrolobii]
MKPIEFTYKEGGNWYAWLIHSVRFDNGMEWDEINGWRKNIRIRVKMGRAEA